MPSERVVLMTDAEFLTYCDTHSYSVRCGFITSQLARLCELAGRAESAARWCATPIGVVDCNGYEVRDLVSVARARLSDVTSQERIRLSRVRGWRMPEGAINVARPTKWGNPFVIGQPSGVFTDPAEVLVSHLTAEQAVEFYHDLTHGFLSPEHYPAGHVFMDGWRHKVSGLSIAGAARLYLRGHDLACWCGLCDAHKDGLPFGATCSDCAPCHADVLGMLSNKPEGMPR